MERVQFGIYTVYCDAPATRLAYRQTSLGYAEICDCLACRNFVAAGERAYPPNVLALFRELGVDYRRAAHVYTYGEAAAGQYHYEGWFHFVGRVEQRLDALEQVTPYFTLWFHAGPALIPQGFENQPLGVVEFANKAVPWVLDIPPPLPP